MISKMLTFFFSYLVKSQIPEEEKNIGPNARLIHVYHFTKESGPNQVVAPKKLKFLIKKSYLRCPLTFFDHCFFCSKFIISGTPSFW